MEFETLKYLDLRLVWANEAIHFTPPIDSLPEELEVLGKWVLEELIAFRKSLFPTVFSVVDAIEVGDQRQGV